MLGLDRNMCQAPALVLPYKGTNDCGGEMCYAGQRYARSPPTYTIFRGAIHEPV
jgi:hypothetical protein